MNLKKLLNLFGLFRDDQGPTFTGALLPTQSDIDSKIKFEDIVSAPTPVTWKPLDLSKLPDWTQYDQGQKNECVASTKALMDSIKFFKRNNLKREVKFSAEWIYKHRVPKVAGMVGTRAIDITRETGNVFDAIFPTCKTDYDIDNAPIDQWMYDEAKVYRTNDEPILPPIKDIDTLASILQVTDKPIMTWFDFRIEEWKDVPYVSGYAPNAKHSVCFIPPKNVGEMTYGIYEGEKAIVIQDSWGLQYGINGKRIIKKSFFNARNIFNQYDMKFRFDVSNVGISFDGTIISAQKCLQSGGFFPFNVAPVNSWGPVSRGSAVKFQAAYGLPQTGLLDSTTQNKLRQLFP